MVALLDPSDCGLAPGPYLGPAPVAPAGIRRSRMGPPTSGGQVELTTQHWLRVYHLAPLPPPTRQEVD